MKLHIGPGKDNLPGFVTLDIRPGYDVQADAEQLPFADNSFEFVYASHIIEHIPWWKTVDTLKEWARVLKPGGHLEIWTVDALKVANFIVQTEERHNGENNPWIPDRWRRHNREDNPYLWAAGRIYAYGDRPEDPNWHKALLTPRHLMSCFREAGLDPCLMDRSKVRGKDHGWINLGVRALKPDEDKTA